MTVLLLLLLACGGGTDEPQVTEYIVVRGDSLSVIAHNHGVTVDQLRAWNDLDGDGLEIGQVIRIEVAIAAPASPAKAGGPRRAATSKSVPTEAGEAPLPSPRAKKCIPPPTGDGLADEGAVASAGLDRGRVKAGMDSIIGYTLRCVPPRSGTIETEITVGCNGLVSDVRVLDAGPYDAAVGACVQDTLKHGEFDAHQLPDGMTFRYPLVFNF